VVGKKYTLEESLKMEKRKYRIVLTQDMLGTSPKDPEVYATYIESKRPQNDGNGEVEADFVEKIEEKGWTGFLRDENGLFIYDYMVRGFMKNAGNVLKDAVKVKSLRSKIDNYLFVQPRRIYLGQEKPDGVVERPLRAMTMQGPRVTLARSDKVSAGKEIEFHICLIPNKEITWDLVDTLLVYGELCGLGQFRNGGYGRFEVL
jgi:hypothetical protein